MVVMLRIHVFGALEVELDGDPVTLPRGRLVRSLLAWLALHPGPHPRTRVCTLFWPDAPDAKARASLRSAMWALRIALGPSASALHTDRDIVDLRRNAVWVDAVEFDRLRAAGHAEQAIAICRGELLADHDEEWVRQLRDEYGRRLAALLAVSAQAAESGGDVARARDRAHRRALLRPLDDEAGRELIRLSAAAGDLPAAMTAFTRLRDALRTELDLDPTAATVSLMESLRPQSKPPDSDSIRPGIDGGATAPEAPVPNGSTRPAPVLPAATTMAVVPGMDTAAAFFGRTAELHDLVGGWHRVCDGAGMAVAIVGDGGIGKTRLAEEMLTIARRDGARTAIGAPGALGGAPYELWSEMLAEVLEPDDRLPGDALWAANLSRLLPSFAAHSGVVLAQNGPSKPGVTALSDNDPAISSRTPGVARLGNLGAPLTSVRSQARPITALGVEHDRIRLFEAVVEFLGFLAARRPLVLVLEDLHAADLSSLELLRYAGRRLSRLPVLLILTRRPLPPRPQLDGVLGALRAKGALRLELGLRPLPPQAIRLIIREAAHLPESLENRILAAVDGNPLLAAETARHVARGTGDPGDGLRVAAASAMARLSESGRLFHELLAASGRDLNRAEIMSLPLLADPATAATESLGAGLLRVREDSIGYRHESLRQAVYDDIPQLRRVRLHDALASSLQAAHLHEVPPAGPHTALAADLRDARVADVREASAAGSSGAGVVRDQRRSVELARHLRLAGHRGRAAGELRRAAAGRAGRPDMAYSCLANAAGAAACAGDFERALDFVERCLPLVVPNGLTRLAVYVYTGQSAVLRRLGRAGEAAAALAAADTAAGRLGIPALDGLVHSERAQLALDRGDYGTAAGEFRAALAVDAPISRPLTRLYLAEALTRDGRTAEAGTALQAIALEPMSDSDFPDTLVARMNRVEGLLAARDGNIELATTRLLAAVEGWRRRATAATVGRRYAANIIDLGRPPLSGLVEPDREYRLVTAELAALTDLPRSPDAHLR
ncbi:AAA family ATPase [Nocardia seriolae]|uniref:AAA family ATPase n=2 Tax=Nocardia seriolae TaxID=37332 RepID=UPI0009DD59C4|nr:AAA family ATPase [Nocardia seriolae]MTJ65363.1 AAA family ATPase [Nocardia seriolae]MTJ71870.1 AAA family ATPase [Nocardia seriolae]MTJ90249.1 AAA family ATPase [Nocardia seriolae]MTK34212.1 AAA family ATPase [Nocardia seriolae]MTK43348.1 AAA family ATPase [Nocardia seriolae]